jgi:beta-glucanase (GH16 family)
VGIVNGGWQLTWSDEFESDKSLDTSKWNTFYPFEAVINSELEYYTPDAFAFNNGVLEILQEKKTVQTTIGTFHYTSGVITTLHKFSQAYGYFEMKAQVPQGLGFWPAFWLLPEVPLPGVAAEIDVMEMIMNLPQSVYTTYHCNYSSGGGSGHEYKDPNFSTGFHTFGLQWLTNSLIWYVDGVQVFNYSGACVPNRPEYILANVAIGGSWPKPPDSTTPFPSHMAVDYIRAYKYVANGGTNLPGPGAGIEFTPKLDPLPRLALQNPKASPQVVAPGAEVTFTFTIVANTETDLENLIVQFPVKSIGEKMNGPTVMNITVPAGSPSTKTVSGTFTVPSDLGNGWLKAGVGLFTSTWQNIFWQDNVWAVQFKLN